MPMYGKNHYNIVIILQLIKINEKKQQQTNRKQTETKRENLKKKKSGVGVGGVEQYKGKGINR